MHVVEMEQVRKIYTNSKNVSVQALRGVSLQVEEGEFVAITGPSGSGKSTLLHLLGGLESKTGGIIKVNGTDLNDMSEEEMAEFRRKDIGFVFQKFHLIPMLNVRENITLPILLGDERVDDAYIDELIELLGLTDRTGHMPGELSGGQQQRVSIGRALAAKPGLILADEPTGNLDQKTSNDIIDYLKVLNQKLNQTIVMITHDMNLALQADRVIEIVDGLVT